MCNFATDISTKELAHLEMVATIVHQLTRNLSMEEIEDSGFTNYYVDHTIGIWPKAANGMPFSIRMSVNRSNSCGHERSCISRDWGNR